MQPAKFVPRSPLSFACLAMAFVGQSLMAQINSTNIAGTGTLQPTASFAAIIAGNNSTNGGTNSAIIGAANSIVPGTTRFAFIGAGNYNSMAAGSHSAAMIGGFSNTISSGGVRGVTIGGGFNTNAGRSAVILGGELNQIGVNSTGAVVAGGIMNSAFAPGATVPGGATNEAAGINSFAAGTKAVAAHDYSFVWGGSPAVDTESFGPGTFTVRAPGGVKFLTSTNETFGVQLSANDAGWSIISDSNAKTDVRPINHRETLAKLAAMPVTEWEYKHAPGRRYIGPMAQDFHESFGLGEDEKRITTLDTDGVTLSAIKGLVEELHEQDQVLADREAQIEAMQSQIKSLRNQIGL